VSAPSIFAAINLRKLISVAKVHAFLRAPACNSYSSFGGPRRTSMPLLRSQVALQVAYVLGNMHWAESNRARLVLQLLDFPKAGGAWDLALVGAGFQLLLICARLDTSTCPCGPQTRNSTVALHCGRASSVLQVRGPKLGPLRAYPHSLKAHGFMSSRCRGRRWWCRRCCARWPHAARRGAADGAFEHSASEPYLGHLDGSLRATYALVWAAGKPRACMQVRSHAAAKGQHDTNPAGLMQ